LHYPPINRYYLDKFFNKQMAGNIHNSSTSRTKIRRLPELANHDQEMLHAIIDEAYICHIAFSAGNDVHCIPTAHWRLGNSIYIHGANGSRVVKALLSGAVASVAITHLDGLVLAKAAFNHGMNYRSAVIYGSFEIIESDEEKLIAFDHFMEKISKDRKDEARRGDAKELAATALLKLSLEEAAVKVSNATPSDSEKDMDRQVWTGVLPLAVRRKSPICSDNGSIAVPEYIQHWED
jgi:nitroimidazol reductase NimA-like FMN-containing flavoprotein (pyridoxamine 5'-phosphate oxidase superfamily)